jgi:hypothetical protein
MHTQIYTGEHKGKVEVNQDIGVGVDRRIILKRTLNKCDISTECGLI